MFDFQFYAPTKVIFGRKAEEKVGQAVADCGATSVLVHFGGGSVVKSGLLARVTQSLDEAGIKHVELGGVVPNPRLSLVREGVELAREHGVDFVLAVGGGSVIDSAKAIGYGVVDDGGDLWDFFVKKRKPIACLPVGVVLTIAAAGSEMSHISVITNEADQDKRSCNSDLARPRFAIMDPELLATLPDYQTGCGTTDILMRTMERYFTNGGNMELTDQIAEGLMRTVIKNGLILHNDPANYDARAEVMWAGSLSHNGLTGCGNDGGDFVSHNLEHQLSGVYDVAHGAGLAAIWATWARYVYKNCLPRFVRFAEQVMGVDPAADGGMTDEAVALEGIARMEDFFRQIGMPVSIRELGIDPSDEDLQSMAHNCAVANGGSRGSAQRLYEEDFLNIYRAAL